MAHPAPQIEQVGTYVTVPVSRKEGLEPQDYLGYIVGGVAGVAASAQLSISIDCTFDGKDGHVRIPTEKSRIFGALVKITPEGETNKAELVGVISRGHDWKGVPEFRLPPTADTSPKCSALSALQAGVIIPLVGASDIPRPHKL